MQLDFKKLTRFRSQPAKTHEVRYNCPHCGDMRGKLYANFKKGQWTCFHCGASGSILARDVAHVRGEEPRFRQEQVRQFKWLTYPDIRGSGITYLTQHHVPVEDAWVWGVRSGKQDTASRLVVPVKYRTAQGERTVFRVAHATSDLVQPKELQSGERKPLVLTWDGWNIGKPLLPPLGRQPREQQGKDFHHRTAVLVEGAADALRLASACKTDPKLTNNLSVVCLWGKTLSEDNAFELATLFHHFYIVLDREDELDKHGETIAGVRIANMLMAIAEGHVQRHRWSKQEGSAKDPGELEDSKASFLLNTALKRTGG